MNEEKLAIDTLQALGAKDVTTNRQKKQRYNYALNYLQVIL